MRQKTCVAVAASLLAAPCFAQSSVTLFGVVDTTVAIGKGNGAGSADRTQLTHSGSSASRLGVRGTEDLGGGMSASFWLEAGLNTDDGQGAASNSNNQASGAGAAVAGRQGITFNRRSTVSLAGGWGELRLGRDFTPHFRNLTLFDPFDTNGVGTAQTLNGVTTSATGAAGLNIIGPTAVRASNSIGYLLPGDLGGFYGQLQYFMGENPKNGAATEDDGSGLSGRVGWANGPINVALSVSKVRYATTATTGDVSVTNVGGSYDFGVVKLMGHYVRDRVDTTTGLLARGGLIGALFNVGPSGQLRAAYSTYKVQQTGPDPKSSKVALGYVHNLSKRTAVYATIARISNSNGATAALAGAVTAANSKSSGLDFGLRHNF